MRSLLSLLEGGKHSGKKLGDDSYEYEGKVGKWRTAKNGDHMFFPDDKSAPLAGARTLKHAGKMSKRDHEKVDDIINEIETHEKNVKNHKEFGDESGWSKESLADAKADLDKKVKGFKGGAEAIKDYRDLAKSHDDIEKNYAEFGRESGHNMASIKQSKEDVEKAKMALVGKSEKDSGNQEEVSKVLAKHIKKANGDVNDLDDLARDMEDPDILKKYYPKLSPKDAEKIVKGLNDEISSIKQKVTIKDRADLQAGIQYAANELNNAQTGTAVEREIATHEYEKAKKALKKHLDQYPDVYVPLKY